MSDISVTVSSPVTKIVEISNSTVNSAAVNDVSNRLILSGASLAAQIASTGHYLLTGSQTGILTGEFYPLKSNPSGYILPSQTGNFAANTGVLTGIFYPLLNNPSGFPINKGTGFFGDNTINSEKNSPVLFIGRGNDTESATVGYDGVAPSHGINFSRYWGGTATGVEGGIYSYSTPNWGGGLYFQTKSGNGIQNGSGNTALVLQSDAKVTIGTGLATERLRVEGRIQAIDGFISGSTNLADIFVTTGQTGIFQTTPVTGLSGYIPMFANNGSGLTNSSIIETGNTLQFGITNATGLRSGIFHINPQGHVVWNANNTYNFGTNSNHPSTTVTEYITVFNQGSADSWSANSYMMWAGATRISYDTSHTLSQRNGTSNQSYRLYSTYTNNSTGSWLEFQGNTGGNLITSVASGTGALGVLAPLQLGINRTGVITISTGKNVGVNKENPDYPLDVSGGGNFSIAGTNRFTVDFNGAMVNNHVYAPAGTTLYLGANGYVFGGVARIQPTLFNGIIGIGIRSSDSYGWSSDATSYGPADLVLSRDGPGVLAQRNASSSQTGRIYSAYVNSSTGSWLEFDANTGYNLITTVSSGTGLIPLQLGVNRSGNITVRTNGNVGINTSSPSYPLTVNGSGSLTNLLVSQGIGIGTLASVVPSSPLDIQANGAGQGFNIYGSAGNFVFQAGGVNGAGLISSSNSSTRGFSIGTDAGGTLAGSFVRLQTAGTDRIIIDNNGNVGIKNFTPSYALDVSGSGNFTNGLSVSGNQVVFANSGTSPSTNDLNVPVTIPVYGNTDTLMGRPSGWIDFVVSGRNAKIPFWY